MSEKNRDVFEQMLEDLTKATFKTGKAEGIERATTSVIGLRLGTIFPEDVEGELGIELGKLIRYSKEQGKAELAKSLYDWLEAQYFEILDYMQKNSDFFIRVTDDNPINALMRLRVELVKKYGIR